MKAKMACVEAIPVPDSRQKVDELFLFWLSESSTQDMLRKELSKVCGALDIDQEDGELLLNVPSLVAANSVHRPGSPIARTPSPPMLRSPKSPRSRRKSPRKARAKSPRSRRDLLSPDEVDIVRAELLDGGNVNYTSPLVHSLGPLPLDVINSEPVPTVNAVNGEDNGSVAHNGVQRPLETVVEPAATATPDRVGLQQPPCEHIPRFYFPHGKPQGGDLQTDEGKMAEVSKIFQEAENGELTLGQFQDVTKVMGLPLYWKCPLFRACARTAASATAVSFPAFRETWLNMVARCHDDASRFVWLLAEPGCCYLTEESFHPLLQDIIDTHPGLAFLATSQEFHTRYIETVIGRIFYVVDRNWLGKISAAELRRSNFLQTLASLEDEGDINQVVDYFSYEHFYVIYCKFWELDSDHDLIIDAQDLARHSDHALTTRIIERILSGVVTRDKNAVPGKMTYKDFIWFLLSEEDKTTPRSIEYWFRCMDCDGDGVLSLYELEWLYEEVLQRLQELNIDCLSVENTVCQVLDMVNPRKEGQITLRDLKTCKLTPAFFNTFVNIEKYLDYEQRDPVTTSKDGEGPDVTDWERFAADQYEVLLAQEEYENENFEDEVDSELDDDEKEMLSLLR